MTREDHYGDAYEPPDEAEAPAARPAPVAFDSPRGVEIRRFIVERLLAGDTEEEIEPELGRRFGVPANTGPWRPGAKRPTDAQLNAYLASLPATKEGDDGAPR